MDARLLNSLSEESSTRDVARALGLAVRSIQLMVDRGELQAWRTPGGHRRIARSSVEQWLARREGCTKVNAPEVESTRTPTSKGRTHQRRRPQVLLVEDSAYFQNLVSMLLVHDFPQVDLHVAEDGIVGLAMAGELQPDVLLVDILLPGVDGATLIARLRTHPQFHRSRLIVVTSLDEQQRAPYAFALAGLPVVHKPHLVQDLPIQLTKCLQADLT